MKLSVQWHRQLLLLALGAPCVLASAAAPGAVQGAVGASGRPTPIAVTAAVERPARDVPHDAVRDQMRDGMRDGMREQGRDGARTATPSGADPHTAHAGATIAFERVRSAGDDELDSARGGADTTVIDTRLTGQVSGNTANNVQSGWNVIDGGAFANMTGIPIIVQNSGANVLIQNATVIQLQFQ